MAWGAVLGLVGRGVWGLAKGGGKLLPDITNIGGEGLRLAGAMGHIQDEITVRIKGGPRSDNKSLFRLAAAIAFGRVKAMVPAFDPGNPLPPPGMIGVHYHVESREIMFILRTNQSLMTITTVGAGAAAVNALPVFSGPDMTTIGDTFKFIPPTAPGAPAIAPPVLEFAGKTILTEQFQSPDPEPGGAGVVGPTKNHRPSGDARSRGSLVRMVTAALSQPTEFGPATFNLPTNDNRFTGG